MDLEIANVADANAAYHNKFLPATVIFTMTLSSNTATKSSTVTTAPLM
jgi:hypothetical protein